VRPTKKQESSQKASKKYYHANKEAVLKRHKKHYETNREKLLRKGNDYYAKNVIRSTLKLRQRKIDLSGSAWWGVFGLWWCFPSSSV
jgi:hypothetical protein